VQVGVIKNAIPYFIIGQDVIGGDRSCLRTVGLNSDYSMLTVVDIATGHTGTLHYVKNVHAVGLPQMNMQSEAGVIPRASQLFRGH